MGYGEPVCGVPPEVETRVLWHQSRMTAQLVTPGCSHGCSSRVEILLVRYTRRTLEPRSGWAGSSNGTGPQIKMGRERSEDR